MTMNEERPSSASWNQRYADESTPWDRGAPSPALLAWLDAGRVAAGPIVVPGCGSGHEVVLLCERGFRVTAVDFAESALALLERRLRERGLSAELVCEDFLTWRPRELFDTVYEQTALCALPPSHWPAYADALARWLRPDGTLLALFMQTGRPGGPPWHCDPVAMCRLFRAPGWRWLEGPGQPVPHPAGFRELPAVLARRVQRASENERAY